MIPGPFCDLGRPWQTAAFSLSGTTLQAYFRFASPHDDGMGTEAVSGAARARVDAAREVVHVTEHFDVQTSCPQEGYVSVFEDRPDHTLGPKSRIRGATAPIPARGAQYPRSVADVTGASVPTVVDAAELERKVRDMYTRVALDPHGKQ